MNTLLIIFLVVAPVTYFFILCFILKKEIKESKWQIVILAFLAILFLNKLLFKSQSLAQGDFNNIQIPLFHFFQKSILTYHQPPVWNNLMCGGFDAFMSPLAGYFSMFNWVFLIFKNVYQAFNFYLLFQIILCGVGAYLMLKEHGFSKASSLFGSIIFTYNGFVTMRLSPGVGVEYLFAYKWLPFILLFTKRYLKDKKILNLLGLSISLAFSLEGNTNIVIAMGVMWLIYLLFSKPNLKILLAPVISFFIYSIKLIPALDLFSTSNSRLSSVAAGWRQGNFDLNMFPWAYLPIKFEFTNGTFTPGLVAALIFLFGLVISIYIFIKNKKQPFNPFLFSLFIFVLGFFITIENPFYFFFFSLPLFNKVTQIPSFVIFYLIPIVFFASFGFEYFSKTNKYVKGIFLFVIFAQFFEIFIGPSIFGKNSYSFNFAKLNYLTEPYNFSHYNLLNKYEQGTFFVYDHKSVFLYPYGISLANLETLNTYGYFFGCGNDNGINKNLSELIKRTDYILSTTPIENKNINLLDKVSVSDLKNHQSHAVFEQMKEYYKLSDLGWDDDLYVYKTKCEKDCALKNESEVPGIFKLKGDSATTSINYSKNIKSKDGVEISKDEYGYVKILSPKINVHLYYQNNLIYLGTLISLGSLLLILFITRKRDKNTA